MTVYNGNITNLLQGVSQQPRRDRRPEQLEVQKNAFSNITMGVGKRPGTTIGSTQLNIPGFSTAKKHTYDRGSGSERYTIIAGDGVLKVIDLETGTERTVNGSARYLRNAYGVYEGYYSLTGAETVVRAAFLRLFGREPLHAGLLYWTDYLMGLSGPVDQDEFDATLLAGASWADLLYYNTHQNPVGYYTEAQAEAIVIEAFNRLFSRNPTVEGLSYWVNYLIGLDSAVDPTVFDAMLLAGSGSNIYYSTRAAEALVMQEFNKLFGRNPAQAGLDYWTDYILTLTGPVDITAFDNMLIAGASATDREYYLYHTVEGYETPVLPADPGGYYTESQATAMVVDAFNRLFNRAPKAAGLEYWVDYLLGLDSAINSTTFDNMLIAGAGTKTGYYYQREAENIVIDTFNRLFNRDPLQAGLDYWAGYLMTLSTPIDQDDFDAMVLAGAKS